MGVWNAELWGVLGRECRGQSCAGAFDTEKTGNGGGGVREKGLGLHRGPGGLLPVRRKSWQQGAEETLGQRRRWPWRESLDGKREVSYNPGLRQGSLSVAAGFMQC